MKIIRLLIISLSFSLLGLANSFTEIKSSIKAYDFNNASSLIDNYIQSNPASIDPEIYILKFINEIALAFEVETPKYLIDNFNAVETRAYNAFDLSGDGVELSQYPLVVDSQTVGYWYTPINGKFPTDNYDDEYYNEIRSLVNWEVESKVTSPFSQDLSDGPYYYGNNHGDAISFQFKTDNNSGQAIFIFEVSETNYSNIRIILNGDGIGYVSGDSYFLYNKSDASSYNFTDEDGNHNHIIRVPLYLEPGDLITFEHQIYDNYTASRIGVMPANPFFFEPPEEGISYYNDKPDYGEDITVEDILSFFTQGNAPARTLINTLISDLDNFATSIESWNEDYIVLGHSFTELNSNILIQKSDALAIKSILEIIDVIAGIINQYDLDIDIYDNVLDDGDELYNTAKEFLDAYQEVLSNKNTSDNLSDQLEAKSKLTSALTSLETIIPILWYRGSPDYPTDSYLIETSSSSDSDELQETENQLAAIKNAINGFEKTSALNGDDMDGGASISFSPFLASDYPLNIRQLAYQLSDSNETETFQILNNYGFIKDYLPNSFDGKILVFYDSNNEVNSALILRDNYYFDSIEGELRLYNFSNYGDSSVNWGDLNISYLSRNSGTWKSDGYTNFDTYQNVGPLEGTFYFYDSLLDLNGNGQPDVMDLYDPNPMGSSYNNFEKKIDYSFILDSSLIDSYQLSRYPTPQSLKGFINLVEDDDYNDYTMQYESEIEAGYFISNDDWFEIDLDYDTGHMRTVRSLDIENYEINGDIITFTETISDHNDMDSDHNGMDMGNQYDEDVSQLFFNDQFSYIMLDIEDSNYMDMPTEYESDDIDIGVIYPAYLDLDNDGLADGEGMKAQIRPNFNRLPTSTEIQAAIDAYNQVNNNDANNGNTESPDEATQNPNALTDSDGDNMPDALELRYSGNSNDPNDATITLNQILSVDRYTLNEITDLRLGSTLYEVSQGIASFNIILEESTDMVNWVQHEPMEVNLGQQPDDSSKFYRFKMSD